MRFVETVLVAISTYSALPVPQFTWNERNMRYAICFFPVVGVICGAVLLLWNWVSCYLRFSPVLFAAVAVCLPLLTTGGIHMDGYMDTVDALASHRSRERMLEIMKDPGCGAFAVIYCGVYLLLHFGLFFAVYEARNVETYALVYILSRALSAICAVTMPNARGSGMLCAFTENAQKNRVMAAMIVLGILISAALILINPLCGGAAVLCSACSLIGYRCMAMRKFGGVTGDTSGYFLQICELSALGGVWLGGLL